MLTLPKAAYFYTSGYSQLLWRRATISYVPIRILIICGGRAEHLLELAVLLFLLWGCLELLLFIRHRQYSIFILHVEV
jgi:hypothetical protein